MIIYKAFTKIYILEYIGLTTKWLRILSIPSNDKIRNHLVANPIIDLIFQLFKIKFIFISTNFTSENHFLMFLNRNTFATIVESELTLEFIVYIVI